MLINQNKKIRPEMALGLQGKPTARQVWRAVLSYAWLKYCKSSWLSDRETSDKFVPHPGCWTYRSIVLLLPFGKLKDQGVLGSGRQVQAITW